jgi:ribulose-5-phosphate 4-epimerase/fuculose-1-phosphate aldolase
MAKAIHPLTAQLFQARSPDCLIFHTGKRRPTGSHSSDDKHKIITINKSLREGQPVMSKQGFSPANPSGALALDPVARARIDLAAALRWAAKLGLGEGICNHFSLALPGPDDRYLINPFGVHWAEMRASHLLMLDRSGRIVEGQGEVEATAFHIHSQLHRARTDAIAVLHTHMPYATALTLVEDGRLAMVHQNSLRFHDAIAYDDHYNGLALDQDEGDRLAIALGAARVMFLANHGVVTIGASLAEAFDDLYYLERAAELQVLAHSTGRPLRPIADEVVRRTAAAFARDRPAYAHAHFEAVKRLLDAEDPSYRD